MWSRKTALRRPQWAEAWSDKAARCLSGRADSKLTAWETQ